MDRRTWFLVLIGGYLGGAVGLAYAMTYDVLCACQAIVGGTCGCSHDEIFGWQPGWLAIPIWTLIGAVGGGMLGFVASRLIRHGERIGRNKADRATTTR